MPKKRHISLKDLAKELGVSVSTVSRALNDSYEIGPEMRERVKALAEEWNYRPNPFALSLLKNTPRIIGNNRRDRIRQADTVKKDQRDIHILQRKEMRVIGRFLR